MSNPRRVTVLPWIAAAVGCICANTVPANSGMEGEKLTVVELFTSQGCSSCPPADAIAGRLRANPSLLVLSFHVNYWDHLGWKDPFASESSTDRQYAYERALGQDSAFTPQLIVNGIYSSVGSRENEIRHAIEIASQTPFSVHAELAETASGALILSLAGRALGADVWEVRFVRNAATTISRGENGGRILDTYNNVTRVRRLGTFEQGHTELPPLSAPDDGLAVIVQAAGAGAILGAAAH